MSAAFIVPLILALSRAALNANTDSEVDMDMLKMGMMEISVIETIDKVFPPIHDDLAKYPFVYLSAEVWAYLADKLDATSLWNLGLTCKTIGAALRLPEGFPKLLKKFTPPEILDMFAENELIIGEWVEALMSFPDNLNQMKMIVADDKRTDEEGRMSLEGQKAIFDAFVPRAQSLTVTDMLMESVGNPKFIEITSSEAMQKDFIEYPGFEVNSSMLFYLPLSKEQKLFDLFNPSDVGSLLWCAKSDEASTLFACSIMTDFVLPVWRREYTLSTREKSLVRKFAKLCPAFWNSYFEKLVCAVRLIEMVDSEAATTTIETISSFIEDLGFEFNMKTRIPAEDRKNIMNGDMKSIFAVADQWKLDCIKLAKATICNPISRKIEESGTVPAAVLNLAGINESNIFEICLRHSFVSFLDYDLQI